MNITPLRLVVPTSALILIISGCSSDPTRSVSPDTGKVSYDHSQRKKLADQQYINRYQKAFIRTKSIQTSPQQNTESSLAPTITLASYSPSQKALLHQRQQHNRSNINATWKQVHQGFGIRNYNHKSKVRRYIRAYSKMPQRMATLSHRSSPYLPTIINEVNRRNIPTEIALLPFVESAFNDRAYSPAHAAGLWQFIPETARRYGLHVSSRYDARYNWKASTNAALDYLQDLNREFRGDWLLSLAAYNCGEARVRREIARNRARGLPTDFWHLKLPKETRNYVPRLLAFKEVFGNPRTYNMHIPQIPDNPQFARTQFKPWLHKQKPAKKKYIAKKSKKSKKRKYKRKIITHRVRSGDTLYRIAKRYNTSIRKIMRMNGLKSSRINPGKRLKIASVKKRRYG